VQGRKPLDECPAEIRLAAHEHALPGDEDVLEDDEGLAPDHPELAVARVDASFHLPLLVGLAAEDHRDPGRVERDGGHDRIVLVAGSHSLRGQDHDLVTVHSPRLVRLRSADDYAILALFDNPCEQVRVCLLAGPLGAVTLRIRHAADEHEVFLLDLLEILLEPREVGRPAFLVDLVGRHVEGIQRVEPHATLVAARRLVRYEAQHLHLLDQVVDALVDVGETTDLFPCQMALGRHEVLVLRHQGQLVGLRRRVDVGNESRVAAAVLYGPAVVVDDDLLILQTLDIICFRFDPLHFSPLPRSF